MDPFRAALTDEDGQAIGQVEGTIEPAGAGARSGRFELQETESFMQGVMDGKRFHLQVENGDTLTIKVDSVSTGSQPGSSEAVFSTV